MLTYIARFGNRVFDGPLKEVQIIEVASVNGGALKGTFDVSYKGHSVGVDVGASLSVVEVGTPTSTLLFYMSQGGLARSIFIFVVCWCYFGNRRFTCTMEVFQVFSNSVQYISTKT